MRIVLLSAGTNERSNSKYLADTFAGVLQAEGADITVFRLKDIELAHFTLDHYKPEFVHEPIFKEMEQKIMAAHGLVIATPIWNFGVPAHLKNFIDRMGSFALDACHTKGQLQRKPFFLLFTGGAPVTAWKSLMRFTTSFIREGLRYFGATPAGSFFEGRCVKRDRDQFDLVVDQRPEVIERVKKKAKKFAKVVRTYERTGKPPRLQQLLGKAFRWGEWVLKKIP